MATTKCLVDSRVEIWLPSGQVSPAHAHTNTQVIRPGDQWQTLETTFTKAHHDEWVPPTLHNTSNDLLTMWLRVFFQVVAEMRQLCNLLVAQTGPPCPHNVTRGTEPPFAASCCCGHTQTMPGYRCDHWPGCFLCSPPCKSILDFTRRIHPFTNELLHVLNDEPAGGCIDSLATTVHANAVQNGKELGVTTAPILRLRLLPQCGRLRFILL